MSGCRSRRISAIVMTMVVLSVAARASADGPATQPSSPAVSPAIDLLAVGDWGADTPDRQTTADAMAKYATANSSPGLSAILLLGDNYYVKLKDINDPIWQTFFEKTYDAKRLDVPFYAVLGNHDYKEHDDTIELAYSARGNTRFTMPARYYRLDLPKEHPVVTLLMLDSDQTFVSADYWATETKWIDSELAKPHAQWVVCCGHHDMFGNGNHADNGVLITSWGTLFKKYKVDFYLCGHEHTLQHLEVPGWTTSFVIAGGGGAPRHPMLRDARGPFSRSILGFADFRFDPQSVTVSLVGVDGTVLHSFSRDADGKVATLINTPSDKATEHPLQVINGLGAKPTKVGGGD
jgi:tartrate-resistant acid phosphatase type 5